ncbi:putative Extracellular solute-binding protein,family 5 [[Clostridium] ultunense Esp]|uniref:Putative Extracellular solute-binding protein,family 5 n=1 Tax=[Clostridium] ultunense Esp TaxID=1288971 RepID=M1ZHK3_9FIRM|nr:peptide ABC transporter substrate-binding protein [Schnuerera ultunensis]CCQ98376.1 putative Extracellular solute-binding protein,family 5 [[Clostridium] ultunense Esp]SHD77962.1 putative Extracellular solute-binding protein,family 5 [[Clostridium] ultunense Esp]
MKCRRITITLLIMTILFTLTGCDKNEVNNTSETFETNVNNVKEYEPEYGGQLVLPLTTLKTLNPLISENLSYYYFSKLVFESLFELDENFDIKYQLAEDYTIKDDGTIRIKLRDNVLWHDGEKFTAEDVVFTINTIKYASNDTTYKKMWNAAMGNFYSSNINRIIDVNIIDAYNLDIRFDIGFSNSLETLIFPIIPKHRFVVGREDKNSYIKALAEEGYTPIGTGPYRFLNYDKYKSVQLEYFQDYREGRPYIDQIVGKILEDEELALTAFEAGQIDLTTALGVDWEKFDQNNRVKILEFVSQNCDFIGFNFSKLVFNNEKGYRLRKAMAYGIDRQAIIQRVYLGHATQTDLPIHPNSWLISNEANAYGYNLSKAREELNRLGWKDIDGDGFYEDENGKEIILRLTTNSYSHLRLKTADMIVEDLNKMGIRVIKDYPEKIPDNLTEEMVENQWEQLNSQIVKGDYDIVLLGWRLSPIPELSFAFHSNQIKSGTNIIRYSNEAMDEALLEAFRATNRDKKLKAYEKLQSIITEDLPYVSLFFKNKALLMDKKIMGDIDPTFHDVYRNIEKWYIPKEFQEEIVDKK